MLAQPNASGSRQDLERLAKGPNLFFFSRHLQRQDAVNSEEGKAEGQGVENTDAVRLHPLGELDRSTDEMISGLDNAGKTTIVKKIMGEDVNTVSPTLGFIIKTIDYEGWVPVPNSPHQTDRVLTKVPC